MKYLFLVFSLLGLLYSTDGGVVLSPATAPAPGGVNTTPSVADQTQTTQSPFCTALTDGTPVPKRN